METWYTRGESSLPRVPFVERPDASSNRSTSDSSISHPAGFNIRLFPKCAESHFHRIHYSDPLSRIRDIVTLAIWFFLLPGCSALLSICIILTIRKKKSDLPLVLPPCRRHPRLFIWSGSLTAKINTLSSWILATGFWPGDSPTSSCRTCHYTSCFQLLFDFLYCVTVFFPIVWVCIPIVRSEIWPVPPWTVPIIVVVVRVCISLFHFLFPFGCKSYWLASVLLVNWLPSLHFPFSLFCVSVDFRIDFN